MNDAVAATGQRIVERAQALACESDAAGHYTRLYLTSAHQAAAARIAAWMREAGMAVRVDGIGNVIGRYEGSTPGAKALLIGSHFDSVRNGGIFDGILGILLPIECVAILHGRDERLPCAIEVIAFADEEGARFQTGFLASQALIGRFDPALLARRDADGVTLGEALASAGLDPLAAGGSAVDPAAVAAYLEIHIEQGPVLLDAGLPLGIVTTIAGGNRHQFRVRGEAGHAGTVPMARRRDALTAAAEMVLAIERRCAAGGTLVGTVGLLEVASGSSNVIPGAVDFSLDIRAGDDAARRAAEDDILATCQAIANRRGVAVEHERRSESRVVPCTAWVQDQLGVAVRAAGVEPRRLPSGAGHDAMVLAEIAPIGMLFVRCGAGGVSHTPEETINAEDATVAARAVLAFLRAFAPPR